MSINSGLPPFSDVNRSAGNQYGSGLAVNCCVEGCLSVYGDFGVSFHRFPKIKTARDVLRRELWVEAAGLPNRADIIDAAVICGLHFEMGKPSLPTEIRAPNWTPSLLLKSTSATVSAQNDSEVRAPNYTTSLVPKSNSATVSAPNNSGGGNTVGKTTATPAMITYPAQRERAPLQQIMGPQTVSKDVNLPEFCRLCLAEGVQMVFPKDSRVYDQLACKISDHLRLTITVGELTRCMICRKCYETLEQFHQFRARCARQETYLNMRRCMEPDRKHPLRYKDNWYWYSCLGNSMTSVIWGCSVVCCPAFIVSHPSGRICSKWANHQHKQKMDDVKSVYCNGEYVFDGYRYSFEMINLNRTLTFSCRSLKDPHNECTAVLISNDRSEVLSVGEHNHEREIIIESAVKDAVEGTKRSITLIRGFNQEIVFCQGYWYSTVPEHSSVSKWNCVRMDCTSTITMVNGTVEYFGVHCHLPVFLKWGAEEDKTIETKTTTLMKIVNPATVKPTAEVPVSSVPPVPLRESTTIVHARQVPTRVSSSEIITSLPAIMTEIKTEPAELQSGTVTTYTPRVTSTLVRPEPIQPLVVSAAAMASKAVRPTITINPTTVSIRSNHPIQVVKRAAAPTIRISLPPRPKLVIPGHTPRAPIFPVRAPRAPAPLPTVQMLTPKTSVPAPPPAPVPTIPKILHVMSLNVAHQSAATPDDSILAEPQSLSHIPAADDTEMLATIKQEPPTEPDDLLEDEPETITDDIQPTVVRSAPATPAATASLVDHHQVGLPRPPPLTPRPMMLLSSASVATSNTLDVTALNEADCIDGLDAALRDPGNPDSSVHSQDTLSAAEEDDGLHDLQDDDEIPPIVPIDADVVSRIIGNEYTTRVLPNGKTQVIRKTILSRGSKPVFPSGTKFNAVRVYGSASSAVKRISDTDQLDNTLTKKPKSSDAVDPLDTAVVNVVSSVGPELEELEESAVEDPIAVATEPHENIPSEDPSQVEDSSNDHEEPVTSPEESSSNGPEESIERPITPPPPSPPKTEEPIVTAVPAESTQQASKDPRENRSEKKTSKSVQLVKLQRTEQMLSHEGHLYKLKWYNRRRNYWDCMLREQVTCMAILETIGDDNRHWKKHGSHNHKIPKPIINSENRSSYRMLTNETSIANVKQLPIQTTTICDIREGTGRMMSLSKRKVFDYRIRKVEHTLKLSFANYEYAIKNQVYPGFRWKCMSCSCTLETDEKFTIAQEVGMMHNHDPRVTDVIDLVEDATVNNGAASKGPGPGQSEQRPQETTTADNQSDAKQTLEAKESADDRSMDGKEQPSTETRSEPEDRSTNQPTETDKEASASTSTSQEAPTLPDEPPVGNEDVDPIDAMLQEITGERGDDPRDHVDPSPGDTDGSHPVVDDEHDDDEMTLDSSTGEMLKRGELKRKEHRKALLEDIVADEDDDETEYLDPLTGEMRRKGDQSTASTVEPPLADESTELPASDGGPSKNPDHSNDDFEELLLKRDSPKGPIDTRKLRRPKKNSLAALKMIVDIHKRLKATDPERNFQVLPAPEDDSACLIRFANFTYELDTVLDSISVWKCHLSPQYACRGKVHLSKDCRQIMPTGVYHCHAATQEDMFTELPLEKVGQIMDTDFGATRAYTFFKRPDAVYQLLLDDGYLYNCLTISKTGVSCWRCADRQTHTCKAMFTMYGNFKSLVRNRFSHPHDPVSAAAAAAEETDSPGDEGAAGHSSMDSSDGQKDSASSAKRPAKNNTEDDKRKQKRQTL